MTNLPTSITRTLERARRRQRPQRDDSGLTTLEWLLIVAAVAGIAALAVVLVTNVVGDTSEQISGSSARKTGAQVAAQEIMRDANRDAAAQPAAAKTFDKWVSHYTAKCDRLKITYADVPDLEVGVHFQFTPANSGALGSATAPTTASAITPGDVTVAVASNPTAPTAGMAVAHCSVT